MRRLLLILMLVWIGAAEAQDRPPLPREVKMRWQQGSSGRLLIVAPVDGAALNRCVESGLEYRFRFIVRVCRRRTIWFNSCSDDLVRINSLRRDPVTESFILGRDTLGDKVDPDLSTYSSQDIAVSEARELLGSSPLELAQNDADVLTPDRSYVSARVITDCKGDYNRTLAGLSNILTLGMAQVGRDDTGWFNFNLVH